MAKITVPLGGVDKDYLSQLEYALAFASEDITSYRINEQDALVEADLKSEAASQSAKEKISELIQRYQRREFGLPKVIHFQQERELPAFDAWKALLERKWVTPVGQGHVVLRGVAALLLSLIERKVEAEFVKTFKAELEIFPSTIKCETLDRCN